MVTIEDKKYLTRNVSINGHYVAFKNHLAEVSEEDAIDILKNDEFKLLKNYICDFNPETWTPKYKKLYWEANADTYSGFGNVTINSVKALGKNGIDIYFGGKKFDEQYPDKEFMSYRKITKPDCIVIQYRQPGEYKKYLSERVFAYTPWETTKIPSSWVERMNQMTGIFTSCEDNKKAFIDSGVKVPISVFHHGVDPIQYPYLEREEKDIYTFGTFARLSIRKGTDLLVKAFREEFKGIDDVRLILKTSDHFITMPMEKGAMDDPRIKLIWNPMSHQQILELLKEIDCFVFPSRGEGFGLPAIEAMSTGCPTIMTNWGGLADFGSKKDTMLLDGKFIDADDFTKVIYKEPCGEWYEPNYEQLKQWMRWSYENRKEAKKMGKMASERIHRDWNWSVVVKELTDDLDKKIIQGRGI